MKQLIRQSLFLKQIRCILCNLWYGLHPLPKPFSSIPHVFVTAASAPYFQSLWRLVQSIRRYEQDAILIYDIGLNSEQITQLTALPNVSVQYFNFASYPDHFDLQKYPYGSYAWKIGLIHEALHTLQCNITYLDARNFVIGRFTMAKYFLAKNGYYFPYTSGKVAEWTHPAMLAHFTAGKVGHQRVLNGTYLCFSFAHKATLQMVDTWLSMALDRHIIAPDGCSRNNHRYDQSLLSCLYHEAVDANQLPWGATRYVNVLTHYDVFLKKRGKG